MPLYVSETGLITRFGTDEVVRGADHDGDADAEDNTIPTAIRDAEAEVNSYLGVVHDLPLPDVTDRVDPENNTAVPENLRRVAADIALYRLATDHGRTLTKEKRKRYDDAIKWLVALAKGETSLGLDDPAPGAAGGALVTSNPRIFTRDSTDGLI
jgi:phage gp36-like protein